MINVEDRAAHCRMAREMIIILIQYRYPHTGELADVCISDRFRFCLRGTITGGHSK